MTMRIGIAGLGIIGRSWAEVFRRSGFQVMVFDPLVQAWEGDGVIERAHSVMDLRQCHYVQESLPEDLKIKKDFAAQLDAVLDPSAVVGSSSSAIPASHFAGNLTGAERFLVAHPANPPHLLPIVEIVRSSHTSQAAVDIAADVMRRAGQRPVVLSKEVSGFALNRLQYALYRECLRLLLDGVISVADLDSVVTEGLGMRWAQYGPFANEAMNGVTVRNNFEKFLPTIKRLISEVGEPFAVSDDGWEDIISSIELVYGTGSTSPLAADRDRWLRSVRRLKDGHADSGNSESQERR